MSEINYFASLSIDHVAEDDVYLTLNEPCEQMLGEKCLETIKQKKIAISKATLKDLIQAALY